MRAGILTISISAAWVWALVEWESGCMGNGTGRSWAQATNTTPPLFAVVSFFPLVPIGTYRISREQGSKEFSVLDKKALNWSQVAWIWARALAIVIAIPLVLGLLLRAIH